MSSSLPVMPGPEEFAGASWSKASQSGGSGGRVEVAHLDDGTALRDSKHPGGPVHLYTEHEWECFLDGARNGEFDRY